MRFAEALAQLEAREEPSLEVAQALLEARGGDLERLVSSADRRRREQVGDEVTFVVNRNINFTNVCTKRCHFCAFSDHVQSGRGYLLPRTEIVRRAREAEAMGATEICIQAGLAPELDADEYLAITAAVKEAVPSLHLHAWSPEELKHGARRSQRSLRSLVKQLKDAGLDSVPGTSAEILVDTVRKKLAVGRITTEQWIEVIETVHSLGIRTTATMMFGHIESAREQAIHLLTLRSIQARTGGFTEFVPLAFVHEEAPLFADQPGVRPGPSDAERLAVYATSRLVLGDLIPNLQVSWVKEGDQRTQKLLEAGANDLGGTLINESISTAAGAPFGQLKTPEELIGLAASVGRQAVQRDTLYRPTEATASSSWRADYGDFFTLRASDAFAYRPAGKASQSARVSTSQAKPRR